MMRMKKETGSHKILPILIFVLGFILCSYPLFSNIVERQHQKRAVATYTKEAEAMEQEDTQGYLDEAVYYNSMLYQSNGRAVGNLEENILSEASYNRILNISATGVMGSMEIPKINVDLPIYHGSSEEVLSAAVGHLEGSSFPVGGTNTRAVLTGHRGLPNSKLFTRLDELAAGDLFFIQVLDETLAYRVTETEVIEPDDTDALKIVPDRDLVTLMTCTPYGINTHRLLVTGERVAYEKAERDAIRSETPSPRELFFACLPFLFLVFGILSVIKSGRKKKVKAERLRRGGKKL